MQKDFTFDDVQNFLNEKYGTDPVLDGRVADVVRRAVADSTLHACPGKTRIQGTDLFHENWASWARIG